MIDKIKELLGEELSAKVAEKLGDVELAIMNDGSVVKADKHDKLKEDYKALEGKYSTDVKEFTAKLENASKGAGDLDTLKASLEALKSENQGLIDKYETEKAGIKIDSALRVELIKNNIKENYIDLAMKAADKGKFTIDGDNVIGVSDFVKETLTTFPDMFGEVKMTGAQPNMQGQTQVKTEKAKLIEQYNQATADKNFALAFKLNQQIKTIKE